MIMSVYGNRINVAHCNRIQMRNACTMCDRTNLARYRISMDVNKCRKTHQMHRSSFWFQMAFEIITFYLSDVFIVLLIATF